MSIGQITNIVLDVANDPSLNNIQDVISDFRTRNAVQTGLSEISAGAAGRGAVPSTDWRARLRPKRGGEDIVYGALKADGTETRTILEPLRQRGGLIFPYTPSLLVQASANYNAHTAQGTNYPIYTYMNSSPPSLTLNCDFSCTTVEEAQYFLACWHFLKVATKSYFGESAVENGRFGTPPPVLLFDYLGPYGFHKVPVVLETYSIQLSDDVDYVPVVAGDGVTHVPASTNVTVSLLPQYTPVKLRRKFDLEKLTDGSLYRNGFI